MPLSSVKSLVIQSCMTNDLASCKSVLFSDEVVIDGKDKQKFYDFFQKTLMAAHKKSKGDWSLGIENATWIKDRKAMAYDFYDEKGKQPLICVVMEDFSDHVWMEVLRG